jgi:glycosyltransferase involved in cell wall biosynthesis
VVLNLALHHDRSVFAPAVCFFAILPPEQELVEGLERLGVPHRQVVKQSRYELRALDRLTDALVELRPEIVVLHGFGAYSYGALAARLAGARAVVRVEHSPELHTPLHALFSACTAAWVDSFVLVSRYVGEYLERHGTTLVAPEVIYNGVDLQPFSAVRRPPFDGGVPTLLMTARLDTAKDHATLIEAAALLKREGRTFRLRLAGGGPLRLDLERKVRGLDLTACVEFLGFRDDLATLLSEADLVVLSTHFEGFGLAAVEAMAAGRPVVATDTSALPELVDAGRTGLLVPPKDPRALAGAIAELLDAPERGRAFGAEGRRRAQRFGLPAAMAAFDAHLRTVAGKRGLRTEWASHPEATYEEASA